MDRVMEEGLMTQINSPQPLVIETSFAYDANKSQTIEPEEVIKDYVSLGQFDQDGDKKLKGKELKDIYFLAGEGKWLPAGRPVGMDTENTSCTYHLKEINYEKGTIQLDINCVF
jgi:hypothetical protein